MKFKGLITGLLTGTIVGLFFAPKSGKETRERIKKERAGGGTGLKELGKVTSILAGSLFEYLKSTSQKIEDFFEEEDRRK
jgi:gas vesicle protein